MSSDPHVDIAIVEDMKRKYYRWRYTLHEIFLSYSSVEEALEHPPTRVAEDDWKFLVDLWQKDDWQVSLNVLLMLQL